MLVSKEGSNFCTLKTFRAAESCNASACVQMLFDALTEPENMLCMLADATSLNTGVREGVYAKLESLFNKCLGQDLMSLECIFHRTELLLGKVIVANDGDTRSPDTLEEGAVFNFLNSSN